MPAQNAGARIKIQIKDQPAQRMEVGDCLTIGRSAENHVVLTETRISRKHAEIRRIAPGRYRLSDLGSGNGTWLNGRRLSVPRELHNADVIRIGTTILQFETEGVPIEPEEFSKSETATYLAKEHVVVLATDIRNYTSMTEMLPPEKFSGFIRDWFRESTHIIESHGGVIDKFIGDAVLCYWRSASVGNPESEVKMALRASAALVKASQGFSQRFSSLFQDYEFGIGIGISMGFVLMGNVGTAENQSITIVGDCVNVAFRLEALTRQKGVTVLISADLVPWAGPEFRFRVLGEAQVKGRNKPVNICTLVPTAPPLIQD